MKQEFVLAILVALFAKASLASLNLETQNALIQKLEQVRKEQIQDQTIDSTAITLRLADLYSEKARLLSNESQGKGEQIYKSEIRKSRLQAISLYLQALNNLNTQKKAAALLHLSYLYKMTEQIDKSIKAYTQLISDAQFDNLEAKTHGLIGLADYYFSQGQFTKAKDLYSKAKSEKINPRRTYVAHRISWCLFNEGNTKEAISNLITLLKSKNTDPTTQEEASKDLATYFSKDGINAERLKLLLQLSPEKIKVNNLIYLAKQLDESGKKQQSLFVWSSIKESKLSPADQIDRQIDIARIQYDLGNEAKTFEETNKALILLNAQDVESVELEIHQKNIRALITNWGKAEELNPSQELLQTYAAYVRYYPDLEMNYWAGLASQRLSKYEMAFEFYKNASEIAHISKSSTVANGTKKSADIFNLSLLALLNVAETSENSNLKENAYSHYLKLNPSGEKAAEVRYQIAHLNYENKQYDIAGSRFHEIAIDKSINLELRSKAADLSLDCQNILKNDQLIESLSLTYAGLFLQRSSDFLKINRKSVINQSASAINNEKATESELKFQANKLKNLNLATAEPQEYINVQKNLIIIGHKTKDLELVKKSSTNIINYKSSSQDEKNTALKEKAWAHEMQFQFKEALKNLKLVKVSSSEQADHLFRMALLTELSGDNPTELYKDFLKRSSNTLHSQHAAIQLIKYSKNKSQTFNQNEKFLKNSSSLWLSAGVMVYEQSKNIKYAELLLRARGQQKTFEYSLLQRSLAIDDLQNEFKKLSLLKINTINSTKLKKQLGARLKALENLEAKTNAAIQQQDWVLQFVLLAKLSDEKQRIAKDIQKLPVPRGLSTEQNKAYQLQISEQTKPYLIEANQINTKIAELWKSASQTYLVENYNQKSGATLVKNEYHLIKSIAEARGLSLKQFLAVKNQKQSAQQEAAVLLGKVRQDPFNVDLLEKMKNLNSQMGHRPMVAYLDSRLVLLQQKGDKN